MITNTMGGVEKFLCSAKQNLESIEKLILYLKRKYTIWTACLVFDISLSILLQWTNCSTKIQTNKNKKFAEDENSDKDNSDDDD